MKRLGRVVALVVAAVLSGGCASPTTGSDSYEAGRARVVALANATLALLPTGSVFVPHRELTLRDTDRELCHKTFAAFAYAKVSARRPEITALADLPAATNGRAVLATIEASWREQHYAIDTSGLRDPGFINIHARAGQYQLVATTFSNTAGFTDKPRISVYVTGRCLNG